MSATEAESVLRNLPGIEEAHFDYSPAYDCNQLLDDEESASDIPIPQVTLRFDIDKADQHVAEIYFDQTPAGPILSSIWYYNFLKDRSWAANLRYASKRFGKPDILRSDQEGRHRAFWCQAGEPNCGSDGAYTRRIELMWNPPHGVSGASAGSVTLVADESDEADESRTARYVAVARKDPAAGKRLYNTCRLANGLVFDQADADRRQANLIGDLDTWSPAISEPRRVSIPVLRAAGIDPDALVRDHNCANGVGRYFNSNVSCGEKSAFRWMRAKGSLYLLALRDTNLTGNAHRIYCLVRKADDHYDPIWTGNSLIGLLGWLEENSAESAEKLGCPSLLLGDPMKQSSTH